MSRPRAETSTGRLARLGFVDAEAAQRRLTGLGVEGDALLAPLAAAADPDGALAALQRLVDNTAEPGDLLAALRTDQELARRLTAVLGASDGLAAHLSRHPEHWRELASPALAATGPTAADIRAELLVGVGADPSAISPVASMPAGEAVDRLRVAYRRLLLRLAGRDLTARLTVDEAAAELADLAAGALDAALAIARAQIGDTAASCRLAVIGLGKCGGRELNYVSDVDVLFVAELAEPADGVGEEAALRVAGQLAAALMRNCSAHTGEGTLWPVDAALRPEGRAGPLVRTLRSHVAYCERWAKTWEFQALLKARPVAGDLELGERYVEAIGPLVWQAGSRDGFVADVQSMRRRVVEQLPADQAGRELKLGPGGLRDVEFAVQLLQLVHGRTDESLRSSTTLVALQALTAGGYVGRADGAELAEAYRFLRSLEHRIQLWQLRRTHLVPDDVRDLRRLGRSLGYRTDPAAELDAELARHARLIRRLHEKLFYRPLLAAVARLPGEEARLSPQAAQARLAALGYDDPATALRHLAALTAGVSRRAAIQRTLLPVMLHWFAAAPAPDTGLLAFHQVSDALGSTHWYLRLLRDEGTAAERLARLVGSSRYATELLMRWPEAVSMLAADEELRPRDRIRLHQEMAAALGRHDDADEAITAVRAIRRRELFRVSAADVLGLLDVEQVGNALSDVAAATISAALKLAVRSVEAESGTPLPTRMAVIAMGRLGGHEMGYASDADVMFVHDPGDEAPEPDASGAAHAVAGELRRLLSSPGVDPPVHLDANLRPEGRQGPLVRSLASYAAYYARWSHAWEAQALLRAEPLCGDARLCEDFAALIDPLRWPADGLSDAEVREIRRIKARVDAERLPRSADKATHLKLGRGGLADVEWTVQLMQMRHAKGVPGLRTTGTLSALRAAETAGLVDADDARILTHAWRFATRLRNATMLVRGRPSESLPRDARERAGVAYLCGYAVDDGERLVDDYLRSARRASAVTKRLFWA